MPKRPTDLISKVEVDWSAPYSEALWERLQQTGSKVGATAQPHDQALIWTGLPPDNGHLLFLSVRRIGDSPLLLCELDRRRNPVGSAPDEVAKQSSLVGGRAGLLFMASEWMALSARAVVNYSIRLTAPAAEWACKVMRPVTTNSPDAAALLIATGAQVEQVGYRFDGGANGVTEVSIVYLHVPAIHSVRISANALFDFDGEARSQTVDNVTNLVVRAFFEETEVTNA